MQPVNKMLNAAMLFGLMVFLIAVACGQATPTATQATAQGTPTETSTPGQSGSASAVDAMTPQQLCQCESDVVTNIMFPQELQYQQTNYGPYFVSEELIWRTPITYNSATQMCEGEFAFHVCIISADNLTVCNDIPWQDAYHEARPYVQHTLEEAKSYCKQLYP